MEPKYLDINPFAGNHNSNIIPVQYDPNLYGVNYDNPLVYQNLNRQPLNASNNISNSLIPLENHTDNRKQQTKKVHPFDSDQIYFDQFDPNSARTNQNHQISNNTLQGKVQEEGQTESANLTKHKLTQA